MDTDDIFEIPESSKCCGKCIHFVFTDPKNLVGYCNQLAYSASGSRFFESISMCNRFIDNTVSKATKYKAVTLDKLNHDFFMKFTDEYTAWDIVYAIEDMVNAKTAK